VGRVSGHTRVERLRWRRDLPECNSKDSSQSCDLNNYLPKVPYLGTYGLFDCVHCPKPKWVVIERYFFFCVGDPIVASLLESLSLFEQGDLSHT